MIVIEWLADDERRTGRELYDRLKGRLARSEIECHVEYVRCSTAQEVLSQLARIARSCQNGIRPLVHLEAHGFMDGSVPGGIAGSPCPADGETLAWCNLAEPLRAINFATECNLVVCFAACFGLGSIFSVALDDGFPFVAAVGFTNQVTPGEVLDTSLEFYVELFSTRSVDEALKIARREFRDPTQVDIRCITSAQLLVDAVSGYVQDHGTAAALDERALDIAAFYARQNGLALDTLPYSTTKNHLLTMSRPTIERIVARFYRYDEFPANRKRFAVDVEQLLQGIGR